MHIKKNTFEEARKKAMENICREIERYWDCLDSFEEVGDTLYAFMAMYHEDKAKRIARDWKLKIDYTTKVTTIRWG